MCTVTCRGSRGDAPSAQRPGGPASLTSIVSVSVQPPGSTSAIPRPNMPGDAPRRLTATLATPRACATFSLSDSMARILTGRPAGASSSSSPVRTVPAGSVPVTTVPLPVMLNTRSTHSRTGASASGAGSVGGQLGQRCPQLGQALPGHRADRDGPDPAAGCCGRAPPRPGG